MVSQTFAEHVLRTLAAVTLPESVLVIGEGGDALANDLSLLGFQSVLRHSLADTETAGQVLKYGWAVLLVQDFSEGVVHELLENIRPFLRSGGWVIIGLEVGEGPNTTPLGWDLGASVRGFALAEAMVSHPGGHHAILRRVDADTVA